MLFRSEDELKYEFENDVTMSLKKIDNNIEMEIIDINNNKIIKKNVDPIILKHFKAIKLSKASDELDQIQYLFQSLKPSNE